MTLLVDASVWSRALRRDAVATERPQADDIRRPPPEGVKETWGGPAFPCEPEIQHLKDALLGTDVVVTTGLVLQELLQGFSGAKASTQIVERFAALPLLQPEREDHVAAAELRNACRRAGIQVGTIDALLAQLCIRHDLTLLSTDNDFKLAAKHCTLRVWSPRAAARRK